MKILVVKEHWANKILSGEKTWEIRGRNTHVRGEVGIAISGTGKVFGTVSLIDSKPIGLHDALGNMDKHRLCANDAAFMYAQPHAWEIENAERFDEPIPYTHKRGAVVWVNDSSIVKEGATWKRSM